MTYIVKMKKVPIDNLELLHRISNLEFKERGYNGECFDFAIALKMALQEGTICALPNKDTDISNHFVFLYKKYIIDSNTIRKQGFYKKKMKKQNCEILKLSELKVIECLTNNKLSNMNRIKEFLNLFGYVKNEENHN